jgi:hypothetical protein
VVLHKLVIHLWAGQNFLEEGKELDILLDLWVGQIFLEDMKEAFYLQACARVCDENDDNYPLHNTIYPLLCILM